MSFKVRDMTARQIAAADSLDLRFVLSLNTEIVSKDISIVSCQH